MTCSSSYKTPLFDRTADLPKTIQVSHPKYKFMIEALETVYTNRLKSAFTLIKRSNILSRSGVGIKPTISRKSEKITPRTYKAETTRLTASTLKVQSLLETLKREPKIERSNNNSNQNNSSFDIENSSFDLASAISFLKAL